MRPVLLLAAALLLTSCRDASGPASPLKGDWRAVVFGDDVVLTLDEHDGAVTGSTQWGSDRIQLTSGSFTPPDLVVTMTHNEYGPIVFRVQLWDDPALVGLAFFDDRPFRYVRFERQY